MLKDSLRRLLEMAGRNIRAEGEQLAAIAVILWVMRAT